MSYGATTITVTGAQAALQKPRNENVVLITIGGTTFDLGTGFWFEASADGTLWQPVAVTNNATGLNVTSSSSSLITVTANAENSWTWGQAAGFTQIRVNVGGSPTGTATLKYFGMSAQSGPLVTNIAGAAGSFTNGTFSGTLGVTGATTLSSTLAAGATTITGALSVSTTSTLTGNVTVGSSKVVMTAASGNIASTGSVLSSSATGGVGYATGAGATVTQGTSRTTGVTINTPTGNIVLVSAAGSATPFSFTVTNSSVAAGDTIIVNQKSGTDKYTTQVVTAVAAGSFQLTLANASGTTTEQPVFNFSVIKGVAA